jgi:hypothetical protein
MIPSRHQTLRAWRVKHQLPVPPGIDQPDHYHRTCCDSVVAGPHQTCCEWARARDLLPR